MVQRDFAEIQAGCFLPKIGTKETFSTEVAPIVARLR